MKMNIRKAEIFEGTGVQGWFSLANRKRFNPKNSVPGLNCGWNTATDERQVTDNRLELFRNLGLDPATIVSPEQVHGSHVAVVEEGGRLPQTDALVTKVPGLILSIQVADCAALLLADPQANVVAAVHVGWRGAVNRILPRSIDTMKRLGAEPARLLGWISPCISLQHFEVGEEVARQFPDAYVDRTIGEKPHVDLPGVLRNQLEQAGLEDSRIAVDRGCTFAVRRDYYSWRREREKAGRMLALIRYTETD